jgi:tellurite methyltransferase
MSSVAKSVELYAPFFKSRKTRKILDYGAGKLRNALFLTKAGFRVYAADVPEQVRWIRTCGAADELAGVLDTDQLCRSRLNADLVVSTYVFNIITGSGDKSRYLRNITRNLRPGGYLLIEVCCRKESGECGRGCSRYLKCPSCAKTYSHEELDNLVRPFGFRRVCFYYRRRALAAVYQLQQV